MKPLVGAKQLDYLQRSKALFVHSKQKLAIDLFDL